MSPHYTWGIYLDDYSSGTVIYGNVVDGTVLGGLHLHGGKDNIVENNIFARGAEHQLTIGANFMEGAEHRFMRGNVFRRNIVYFESPGTDVFFRTPRRCYDGIPAECDENLYWCSAAPLPQCSEFRPARYCAASRSSRIRRARSSISCDSASI